MSKIVFLPQMNTQAVFCSSHPNMKSAFKLLHYVRNIVRHASITELLAPGPCVLQTRSCCKIVTAGCPGDGLLRSGWNPRQSPAAVRVISPCPCLAWERSLQSFVSIHISVSIDTGPLFGICSCFFLGLRIFLLFFCLAAFLATLQAIRRERRQSCLVLLRKMASQSTELGQRSILLDASEDVDQRQQPSNSELIGPI